jgi:hypothetical protein
MAGIIEKIANTPIIIRQRTDVEDGKEIFGKNIAAYARVMGFTQTDIGLYGAVQNGKIFLVSPTEVEPVLPAVIVYNGEEYDAKSVKPIRNMKNILLGYRIAAAGA